MGAETTDSARCVVDQNGRQDMALQPLERLVEGIPDANSETIDWTHSSSDIVDGVEVVFASLTAAEKEADDRSEDLYDLVEKIAEFAGEEYVWPVKLTEVLVKAELYALGAGEAGAMQNIKEKVSATGFAEGVAVGVMAGTPDYIKSNLWKWGPDEDYRDYGKLAQNYYNAALALGFANGREVQRKGYDPAFFRDLAQLSDSPLANQGDPDQQNWNDRDWTDYYIAMGGAFLQRHVSEYVKTG